MQFLRMHARAFDKRISLRFLNAHVQPFLCPTAQPPTRARRTRSLNSIKIMCSHSLGLYTWECAEQQSRNVSVLPFVVCWINFPSCKDGDVLIKGLRHSILYSDVLFKYRSLTPFQSTIGKLAVAGMQNVSAAANREGRKGMIKIWMGWQLD